MILSILIIIAIAILGGLAESKRRGVSAVSTGILYVFFMGLKIVLLIAFGGMALIIAWGGIQWLIGKF